MRYAAFPFVIVVLSFAFAAPVVETQGKKKAKLPALSDRKDAFGDPLPVGALARIGTTRYRLLEMRRPETAILSPDGKLLAVLGNQDEIEILELPAWTKKRIILGRTLNKMNPLQFQGLAFSSDGKQLVSCDIGQRHIYLFDVATGAVNKKLALGQRNGFRNPQLALARDSQTLVCTYFQDTPKGATQHVEVWDLAKNNLAKSFDLPFDPQNGQTFYAVAGDGRALAQASMKQNPNGRNADCSIDFWDLATGKVTRKIATDTPLNRLVYSPDGKWLAASNGQSILRIFDVAAGAEKHNIRLRRAAVTHLEFSPDSKSLYIADFAGKISHWDHIAGDLKATFTAPAPSMVRQFAFLPDGKILALGMGNMSDLAFWEVTKGTLYSPINVPTGMISEVHFSAQEELLVACESGHLAWWNPRTASKLRDVKLETVDGQDFRDFSMVSPAFDGGGRAYFDYRRGGGLISLSRGGDYLVMGDGGSYSFHDMKTGKLLYDDDSNARFGGQQSVSFFDDDRKVAAIQMKKVRVWNARTGRDLDKFDVPLRDQEQAIQLKVSPTGAYFAIGATNDQGQGRTFLWDAAIKKTVREWSSQDRFEAMKFSPDNQWLALSGGNDRLVLTRVGAAGDYQLKVPGQINQITQLAFSPDGRQLACAAAVPLRDFDAGRVYIYEIASKKVRLELSGHASGIIERLAYGRDSGLLASGATDTTVLVWNAGLRGFLHQAKQIEADDDLLADWYVQLAGANAKAAFQSMIKLAQVPALSIKMLDAKIAPAKKPDPGEKSVPQWIQDLGNGQYKVRMRATDMLKKIGPATMPELRASLLKANDIETKRRIEELLHQFAAHEWNAEEVLHARAVEILEAVASPQARTVLTRWSTGDPGAVLTQESAKALKQMK